MADASSMPEEKHGTRSGYVYYKCRCDRCRQVEQEYKRLWRLSNLEKRRERDREYGRDNAEARKARVRKHRAENPALYHSYSRKYLEANRDKYAERNRRYRQTERGKAVMRADGMRRRGVPFTKEAKAYIEIIKNDPCAYCGSPSVEIDHLVSVKRGGSGDWDNIAPACRSCNAEKHTKSLLAYLMVRNA